MASRASSASTISGISSVERGDMGSDRLLHTSAATASTSDVQQLSVDQRAAVDQVTETVTVEPLLQRRDPSQHEEQVVDPEMKGHVQIHQTQNGKRSWYHDWWFWEIAGALLSLASTVAIIIMLAVYNHQPVPVLRYGITLNAMLSVLSTIAKTSMLLAATESIGQAKWLLFRKEGRNLIDFNTIDEASRGPWGAFQLLYRFWDGRTVLASAGAFIVLASLAVDPFTQQILSYPSVSNVTSGYEQPLFPKVSSWNTVGDVSVWESQRSEPTSALPLALRAAIYNSILGLGTASSTLNINCPTGNCTFDRSDTLGFCSTCSDVTAELMKCDPIPTSDTTGGTNCTYRLPGDIYVRVRNEETPDDYGSATAFSPQFRATTNMSVVALPRFETLYANDPNLMQSFNDPEDTSPHPGKTLFQGIADPILGFGRILFNNSLDPLSSIGGITMPAATECALHWCVQTLDTSIQNGVLNQTVVRVWSNNSALDTSDVYLQPDLSPETQVVSTNSTSYYVSPMSNLPLVKFLEDVFTATVKGVSLPGMGFTEQEILDLNSYSSDIAQALWYADDLHSLMNNLAARMTDALRNLYSDPASDASTLGNVYTTQAYVLVTWPWLILPVGLVLASCILLLVAVISSSRQQTIVWKSSSLALLFHGFAGGDGIGNGGYSVYRKQMELTAQEMQVRLAESPSGDTRLVRLERRSDKAESSHVGVLE